MSRRTVGKGIAVLLGIGVAGHSSLLRGSRPALALESEDWIVTSASSTTADGTITDVTLDSVGAEIDGGKNAQGGNTSEPVDVGAVLDGMDGDGSAANPYLITDDHELQAMTVDTSAQYELGNPIDCSGTADWNNGAGFAPIEVFTGSFDGNGYTVSGVTIDRPSEDNMGLFGSVDGGTIENVGVTDVDVTGNDIVGGLVGGNGGSVSQSFTDGGTVRGGDSVGGLVGLNEGGGSGVSVSFARCVVTGSAGIGGLIGTNDSTASESYARGTIDGGGGVGGLVGINVGVVVNSYAHGSVTGDGGVGGFVGENVDSGLLELGLLGGDEGTITTSYATASVNGNSDIGGLVGNNEDTLLGIGVEGAVTDSYWDVEASRQADGIGSGSGDVTGLTTDEMTGEDAEGNMNALDFDAVWTVILGGYPVLRTTALLPEVTESGDSLGVSWEGFHEEERTIEFDLNLRGVGEGFNDAGATDFEPMIRGAYSVTETSGSVELGWRDVFDGYALPISAVNHPGISIEDFEAPNPGGETVRTLEVELVAAVPAEGGLEVSEVAQADITVINSDE